MAGSKSADGTIAADLDCAPSGRRGLETGVVPVDGRRRPGRRPTAGIRQGKTASRVPAKAATRPKARLAAQALRPLGRHRRCSDARSRWDRAPRGCRGQGPRWGRSRSARAREMASQLARSTRRLRPVPAFARARFISTTRFATGVSAALEPMVLISRFSSWSKSSFRPVGCWWPEPPRTGCSGSRFAALRRRRPCRRGAPLLEPVVRARCGPGGLG